MDGHLKKLLRNGVITKKAWTLLLVLYFESMESVMCDVIKTRLEKSHDRRKKGNAKIEMNNRYHGY